MLPSVEVRLLGPVEFSRNGIPVQVTGAKQVVLAMLALRAGQVISSDSLLDALYGSRQPKSGANSLQVLVSGLRLLIESDRRAPTVVISQPPGYRLQVQRADLDVTRFEDSWLEGLEAFQEGDLTVSARLLGSALELWRGEPLAGLAYESVFAADIARLEEMKLACTEDLIDIDLARGRHASLIGDLERIARLNPLRERLQGQLMLALYRAGRQSDALLVYRRAREALVEELGIEPSAALARVERQILQQDPGLELPWSEPRGAAPPAGAPAATRGSRNAVHLPGDAASFVGRHREVDDLVADLSRHRLVTLTGLGGSGKTRLAIQAARVAAPAFPGGVTFADLSSATTVAEACEAVTEALELEHVAGSRADRLPGWLAPDSLLLLDNAEQIAGGNLFLRRLLDDSSAHLLVTSRVPIGVAGEVIRAVPPLAVPDLHASTTRQAVEYDAVTLFTERASEAVQDIQLDPEAVAVLVRLLDGVPLAIELAAARLRVIDLATLTSTLAEQLTLLSDPTGARPHRHHTLETLLRDGWDRLSPNGQQLLTALSAFRSGASASAVTEVSGLDAAEVIDLLTDLLNRGLTRSQHSADAGPRFHVLELVRRFTQQQADPDRLQQIRLGHARHMADMAVGVAGTNLRRNRDDLREAIRTVASPGEPGEPPMVITVEQRVALGRSALAFGWWADAVTLLSPIYPRPEAANPLGVALLRCGEPGDVERGRRLLAKAAKGGDADAASVLGGSYKASDPKRSYAWYLQALQIDETDPYALGNVLEHEVRTAASLDIVQPRQAQLLAALERRRAQAARGEDLPWPWYDLARFQLLLGHDHDALHCLLNAVATSTHVQQLQTSFTSLARVQVPTTSSAWAQAALVLELGAAALFHADPPPGRTTGLTKPAVVLAGASAKDTHDEVMAWLDPLAAALPAQGGSLISGGTRQGVSALAAELSQRLSGWRSVGYLPSAVPTTVAADDRYDELRPTDSEQFGTAEPLAYWSDLLASGIPPADVYVLGIGGGPLTQWELHLAFALGANVAIADISSSPSSVGPNEETKPTSAQRVHRDDAVLRAWLTPKPHPGRQPQ